MAELFIELFSEEIPSKLQIDARTKIKEIINENLKKKEIYFTSSKSFSTPKRLVFIIDGIPEKIEQKSIIWSHTISWSFCFLYFLNRIVAETNVTANPPNNGGINVNELSSNIMILVNWAIIGYNEIKTIIIWSVLSQQKIRPQ